MRKLLHILAWLSLSAITYSQSLVAYYPFNGNANDESGNGIHPTYIGAGVTLTTDRFGNANKAYNFDGAVNSYIRMQADMMPTTNRTISLWFNVPDVTNRPGLLGYGGNGSCGTTLLMGINLLGSGQFYVQGHCGNNAAGYAYPAAPVNNWYHWVLTINGSAQKIYVNGQLKSTDNTFSGSTVVSGKDFSLGVITSISGIAPFTDVNVSYLTGKLDDVRIYDAAMTDAQVLQLYTTESTGLVAYYPFNGNANDESGNDNNSIYTGTGVTLTTDRFGNANKAYYFDGAVGSYIRVPADKFPTTDRTISFWFNADAFSNGPTPVSYGGNGCNSSCFLVLLNRPVNDAYNVSGHCNASSIAAAYTSPPVGVWKHWVVTINGSTQKIYINGELKQTSSNYVGPTYVNGKSFVMGGLLYPDGTTVYVDGGGSGYFKGKLDEFRVYNNTFTDAQVQQLFNSESTGLVAYFPFNGNANDESGNANHGTVNGATLTTDRFNNTNKAYAFNGSSNYINVPDTTILRPQLEISLSAWVKRTRFGIDIITEKGGDWTSGTCNFGMGLHNINNNMFYFFFNGGWRGTDGLNDFNWHYYTAVAKNGDANPDLYIDGIQKAVLYTSGAGTISMSNSSLDLHIGAQVGGATYYGANIVDELKIYNRQLSAAEVQQNYNQSTTGLVAYYPFNGNANDESGNGNNGTVIGATLTTDRFGNANKAYNFTNPNHIEVSNSNIFGGEFTVSYWFKIGSYFGQRAAMSNVAVPNGGFQQTCDGTSLSYILGYSFIGGYSPNYFYANYTMQEPVNQWNHLAVTYKKLGVYSSETRLYINGDLKRTDVHVMPITYTPDATFYIGQNHGGVNFQGDLDDIRIYNRILPPNEILQLADMPVMPDLMVYLPMNGDANDKSGNSRNGTTYGGAALTTDKYDNNNSAYYFTNPECGISLASTSTLDFVGQPFAISAWVKYNNIPAADFAVVSKHNCGTPNGYLLGINNNSPRFYLCSGGSWSIISTTQTYNDNKWHHLVATYDGTGSQKLYVDGELKASASSVVFNTPGSGAPIIVGDANGNCGGGIFSASINEVKIYGSVLDAAQVTALYKQSRGSGNAISLKANDYLDIGNLAAENNITIETWVKRNNNSSLHYFISGYNFNSYGFGVTGGAGSNYLFFITQNNQTALSSPVDKLNDGNWHHVAVTNANGSVTFYFDGRIAGTPILNPAGLIPDSYVIGSKLNYQGTSLDGEMDEVRIWNGALLQAEIRDWMTRKVTPDHPSYSRLIRYYNFDERNLFKAIEIKGANTGTLVNDVTMITSGASIGDAAVHNLADPSVPAMLTLSTGENFSSIQGAGTALGLFVYAVKDPPENQAGIVGLGGNDHYFGVKKAEDFSGGTTASYTATYNYTGNTLVTPVIEPSLQLYRRNDNSAATWTNSGAALNTTANTLTVTGQNTEYILGSLWFPLPVTMLNLQVLKTNSSTALLSWQTTTEINNKGFEVQRSYDGNYFTDILFVNGAGNSNDMRDYSVTDVPGRTGRVFYRLKQIDFDGNSKLSSIVSVLFDKQGIIKVYPNPARQQVTIEGIDKYNKIQVLDFSGKLVKEQFNNGQYLVSINLNGFKSGMYLLRLIGEEETQTVKLVIGY